MHYIKQQQQQQHKEARDFTISIPKNNAYYQDFGWDQNKRIKKADNIYIFS